MHPFRVFIYAGCILLLYLLGTFFLKQTGSSVPKNQPAVLQHNQKLQIQQPPRNKNLIEYPSGNQNILNPLFSQLSQLQENPTMLRILYFGDSQIENDRITGTLRKKLQEKFGGEGAGLIAPENQYNSSNRFILELTGNWKTATALDSILPNRLKSSLLREARLSGGAGQIRINRFGNNQAQPDFSRIKLLYQCNRPCQYKLSAGDKLLYEGTFPVSDKIRSMLFNIGTIPGNLSFSFTPEGQLWATGLSLESESGITVDPVPLRGVAFPPFEKTDPIALRQSLNLMKPALIILHFGINVVTNPHPSYNFYRDGLIRRLRFLKDICPHVPVLLIGVSDMAHLANGQLISYENIPAIRQAQKEAASQCDAAFFDLEEFMGGPGSAIQWANLQPPLMQPDYAHFTARGAEKVATALASQLIEAYNEYREKP
jgi:hypothetical protein